MPVLDKWLNVFSPRRNETGEYIKFPAKKVAQKNSWRVIWLENVVVDKLRGRKLTLFTKKDYRYEGIYISGADPDPSLFLKFFDTRIGKETEVAKDTIEKIIWGDGDG